MKKYIVFFVSILLFNFVLKAQISSTSFAANVDFLTWTGTGTPSPARLAAADLNADGKIDVAVPNSGNGTVAIFRNASGSTGWYTSSFVTQSTITAYTNIQSVVLADLDGDGKPDMVTSHGNLAGAGGASNSIYVYQNGSSTGGSIAFYTAVTFTGTGIGPNPASIAAGDIDGDGKIDLVIANYGNGITNNGSLCVLRNTSTGAGVFTFVASTPTTTNINTPYNVKLADFDGDGKLDIVMSCNIAAGYISVYKNNSTTGSITLNAVNTFTAGTNPEYLAVGDIDGDGKPDVAVTNYGSANVSVFRNTSTSSGINFATAVNFSVGTNPAGCMLTDFDGDGKLDGVVLNRTSGTMMLFRNTATSGTISSSSFASAVSFSTNNSPTCIATADLDGDTRQDIIITNQGAANISVFRNQIIAAKPTIASSSLSFSGLTSSSVTLNWTKGNGAKRIILAHAGSAVSSNPGDSFSYSANPVFGSGTQIGSGNYAVYNDTGSLVTVTGLSTGTNYYFTIFEYNGNGAYSSYLISSTLSGNTIVSSNVYYSKSSGALNVLSTWGTNTDGTGTSPTSFSTSSTFYFVQNNSAPSITSDWTVSGTGTLVTFGDGTNAYNLNIPSAYTLTADTISVKSNITLTVQGQLSVNKSYYDVSSTAQYIGTSATQYISPGSYYNLIATGAAKILSGNVTARNLLNMATNITNPSYSFILGASATSRGTLSRSAGIITGNFTRWFGTVTTSGATGLFPIGTSTYY
ncbi:MAG: FG-GAP repeat domain-containing protein, partial [Bacteroidia bacterium]